MTRRDYDPMIEHAAARAQVRLKDGTTATLIDWRRKGDTMLVVTPEYRHRVLPKTYLTEVIYG